VYIYMYTKLVCIGVSTHFCTHMHLKHVGMQNSTHIHTYMGTEWLIHTWFVYFDFFLFSI